MKTSECLLTNADCGSYTKEKESILEYRPILTSAWPECDSDLWWKLTIFLSQLSCWYPGAVPAVFETQLPLIPEGLFKVVNSRAIIQIKHLVF
jgi:hypothetical protein